MFETQREANEAARVLQEEYPEHTIKQGIASEESWKLFGGVNPGSVEMLGRLIGDENEAVQRFLQQAVASRSALKRLIHRKGMAGFDEDVARALSSFIVSNARLASQNYHFG